MFILTLTCNDGSDYSFMNSYVCATREQICAAVMTEIADWIGDGMRHYSTDSLASLRKAWATKDYEKILAVWDGVSTMKIIVTEQSGIHENFEFPDFPNDPGMSDDGEDDSLSALDLNLSSADTEN